jgi:O-antigen ligase
LALILAGARAGWVSYPLILFICWLFSYFSKEGRFESFRFGWKDLVKVAVSVPVTIVISFLLIFQVLMPLSDYLGEKTGAKGIQGSSKASTAALANRASIILKGSKGGRYYTWGEGFNLGRERPIYGMGYESFNWHGDILASIPGSYYSEFLPPVRSDGATSTHFGFEPFWVM